MTGKRNAARGDKFVAEQQVLADLPPSRLDHVHRVTGIKVRSSSTIQVKRYAGSAVQRMPRLAGTDKHAINYRHVIDSFTSQAGRL